MIKRLLRHHRYHHLRKDRLPIQRYSKDYQLGFYIGEMIFEKYLPTTDAVMLQTNHVIPLLPEDFIEYKRLEKEWSDHMWANMGNKKEKNPIIKAEGKRLFDIQLNFWRMAAKKILLPEIKCDILPLPRHLNVTKFKEGLSYFLWDCDMCSYSIEHEDIIIGEEYGRQYIKLKLTI